jgi:hypothetical protein
MEFDFAVLPYQPQTRCSRIIWFHTTHSVKLRMQVRPRKPTTRPSAAGGNIGDNRGNNFCRGGPVKSKTRIGRKYPIYILQAYLVEFHLKCEMAFHPQCMSCQSPRAYLSASNYQLTRVYQTASKLPLQKTPTTMK